MPDEQPGGTGTGGADADVVTRLLRLAHPSGLRVSPSGARVVYAAAATSKAPPDHHARSALWLADCAALHSARQLTSGLFDDRAPEWAPDGRSLVFLSDRAKPGASCALYRLPLELAAEPVPLTPTAHEKPIDAFRISPDGLRIAWVSPDEPSPDRQQRDKDRRDAVVWGRDWPHARLRLLHLASGFVETLVCDDRHVKPQLAWMSDSQRLVFTTQASPDLDAAGVRFEGIDIHSRKRQLILEWPGYLTAPSFVYRGNHVFFIAARDPASGCSADAVWRLELASAKASIVAPKDTACAADICVAGDRLALVYRDDQFDKIALLGSAQTTVFENWSSISDFHARVLDNGTLTLAWVHSSASQPAEVYALSLSDTKQKVALADATKLSNHAQPLGPDFSSRTAHMLRCESRDKAFALEGIVFCPTSGDASPAPRPTVVLIHGGPYSRVNNTFRPGEYHWHAYLATKGYNVLAPNYRGSSGHGERCANAARGSMGRFEFDDVLTLVHEGIRRGFVDAQRIVVGGWSQGGFLSYLAAVRNGLYSDGSPAPFRFQAAICGAGVTDWDMLTMTSDVPTSEAELAGGAPWDMDKASVATRQGSAVWEARTARDVPPVLILHGAEDERVPVTQAVAFHRAALRKGWDCEFVKYPREGHAVKEREHLRDMLTRIGAFCERFLGKDGLE